MRFTFESYRSLIKELQEHNYQITDYWHYKEKISSCILRHDIDQSPLKALELAKIEAALGVRSTYFALLTCDFYNVFSARNKAIFKEMSCLGHNIGLHFDEVTYFVDNDAVSTDLLKRESDKQKREKQLCKLIQMEAEMLSNALDLKVNTVSMHRPSKFCLESDLKIPGMINSYGQEFFKEFKYLSDSRRHWREDALGYIRENKFEKLHILTHAFWYYEAEICLKDTLVSFLDSARSDRYDILRNNFTRLEDALSGKED